MLQIHGHNFRQSQTKNQTLYSEEARRESHRGHLIWDRESTLIENTKSRMHTNDSQLNRKYCVNFFIESNSIAKLFHKLESGKERKCYLLQIALDSLLKAVFDCDQGTVAVPC